MSSDRDDNSDANNISFDSFDLDTLLINVHDRNPLRSFTATFQEQQQRASGGDDEADVGRHGDSEHDCEDAGGGGVGGCC